MEQGNDSQEKKKSSIKFPSFKSSLPAKKQQVNFPLSIASDRVQAKSKPKLTATVKEDVSFGLRLNFMDKTNDNNFNSTVKNENDIIHHTQITEKIKVDNILESETIFDQLRRDQMKFNKNLRKDPQNIEIWIEFIEFQDKIFEKKGKLYERKISILKKAIELNPRNHLLISLHIRLAEEIEDTASLMKLWENYLRKFENFRAERKRTSSSESEFENFCEDDYWKLQEEYLNFRTNRFLAFNFEEINEAFSTAFMNFKESKKYAMVLFKMYISFLKSCGFRERIVGLCQACIEINIKYFNYGLIDLDGYEDQWDAGVMEHIGDEIFREYLTPPIFPKDDKYIAADINNCKSSSNTLGKWIKLERYRELQFWHPIQYIDSEIDDLEGQVLFDDIKDFLVLFKDQDQNRERDIKDNYNLIFIKKILESLADAFDLYLDFEDPKLILDKNEFPNNFLTWYFEIFKILSIHHFKNDWKFNCCFLLFINYFYKQNNRPEEAEIYAKNYLSNNRESFEIFLAYGRYQQLIGNYELSKKVYFNLSKRSISLNLQNALKMFNDQVEIDKKYSSTLVVKHALNQKLLELNESEVYELIRNNPGNKALYLQIIKEIESKYESLAMEVFNLLDEQQLRLYVLLEEVV